MHFIIYLYKVRLFQQFLYYLYKKLVICFKIYLLKVTVRQKLSKDPLNLIFLSDLHFYSLCQTIFNEAFRKRKMQYVNQGIILNRIDYRGN